MNYSKTLRKLITDSNLSLSDISKALLANGINADKSYLSRLQNGKRGPASDKVNDALSKILGIDPIMLKTLAYREKIPNEILSRLKDLN